MSTVRPSLYIICNDIADPINAPVYSTVKNLDTPSLSISLKSMEHNIWNFVENKKCEILLNICSSQMTPFVLMTELGTLGILSELPFTGVPLQCSFYGISCLLDRAGTISCVVQK